ncbi:MAG TPA: hypothetical protein VGM37_02825 [Armatimonadota bacterium]
MSKLIGAALLLLLSLQARAAVVFNQAQNPPGGLISSSFLDPDGMDGDGWAYDSFVLPASHAITEIDWKGGDTLKGLWGSQPIVDFQVSIYANTPWPNVNEPDPSGVPLVQYMAGGDAGATPAGTFGGVPLFDYKLALPTPFQAVGGTKYWVQIEAFQHVYPNGWGIAVGTPVAGSDGSHFQVTTGGTLGGGNLRRSGVPGDTAFTLITAEAATALITASVSPANAGTVTGAGAYPLGSTVSLLATPNPGFGFSAWMENGAQVSNSANYTFTASADRTLEATFVPAYTITTASSPGYAGSTTGDAVYNSGTSVTVTATPHAGFVFDNWTDGGAPVSASATYSFPAAADLALVANYSLDATSVTFDFDTGYPPLTATQASTPFNQTSRGLTASFSSATPGAGGFSVQSDASTHFHMPQFTGNYLNPNSVYNPSLDIAFSRPLTMISFTFATADFNQTEATTIIKVTGFTDAGMTSAVGYAVARGAYIGGTMPQGYISFTSATPFPYARIEIPPAALAASDLLADNITVTAVSLPFTLSDVTTALQTAAGLANPVTSEFARLNAEKEAPSSNVIDILDAIRIARKATGLEPNP